mmetsp:Transcript_2167/g.5135  ORF Transcript_2167/g.5135 Transcript_2167/m.5135 type:complete len:162 (+) Transcript_2167:120-605(+)
MALLALSTSQLLAIFVALFRLTIWSAAEKSGVQADESRCAILCKTIWIGDKNCDKECYNQECDWDGGDCDEQWELRRMIVMGPYYKNVDHVEYTAVGPGGQTRQISFEEGRQWEGNDPVSKEMENDWMALLDSDDEASLPDEGRRTYEHAPWRREGVEVTL